MLVGLAQTLALVPGVSRSGATICMALLLGFARSDAARFSFLLSIPAVAGAGAFSRRRSAFGELGADAIPALAVGTGVAAVTGYASIAWLMRWLGSHQLDRVRDLPDRVRASHCSARCSRHRAVPML